MYSSTEKPMEKSHVFCKMINVSNIGVVGRGDTKKKRKKKKKKGGSES